MAFVVMPPVSHWVSLSMASAMLNLFGVGRMPPVPPDRSEFLPDTEVKSERDHTWERCPWDPDPGGPSRGSVHVAACTPLGTGDADEPFTYAVSLLPQLFFMDEQN